MSNRYPCFDPLRLALAALVIALVLGLSAADAARERAHRLDAIRRHLVPDVAAVRPPRDFAAHAAPGSLTRAAAAAWARTPYRPDDLPNLNDAP